MAQKQYTTYQADILSFELRDALLGIAKPGRYRGFDTFAQYQAPSFPNVYGRITHVDGIDKYDKASPPVLEATRGVAITTQGTIIAEDGNIDLTIVVSNNPATVWHIVYMEHEYTEIQGANPATYGVRSGTPGGGIPTLTSPTSQVPLAYIEEDPLTIDMAGLTYYPAQTEGNYGDHKIAEKLWGSSVEEFLDTSAGGQPGTIPADGIIGNRNFVWSYYVTDYQSITASLNALDGAAKGNADVITTLLAYKLDDWGTPDDNTDLNATTSYHGLLPKLSGDAEEFLNGLGAWAVPQSGWTWINSAGYDFSVNDGTLNVSTAQTLDLTGITPSDTKEVMVEVFMQKNGGLDATNFGRMRVRAYSGAAASYDCPMTSQPDDFAYATQFYSWQFPLEVSSNSIYISYGSFVGSPANWNADIIGNETGIKIMGYKR